MTLRIILIAFVTLFVFQRCETQYSDLAADELRCEYLTDPLVIDAINPRLSWILKAKGRGRKQTFYRVLVASSSEILDDDRGDLWDSERVKSSESINVQYRGKTLTSRTKCFWKVKVWDQDSTSSDWSEVATWSVALLNQDDWIAKWIGFDDAWDDSVLLAKPLANGMKRKKEYTPRPCPYLRKEFTLNSSVESAKVYITALGVYELYINGQRVGIDYFTPGWTDYRKRIYYNTYDVAHLLQEGNNTVAVILADGWYAGNIADRGQYFYGKDLRLKLQLEVEQSDQKSDTIISDQSWKASYGALLEADMQAGETYDARREMVGWNMNGFNDSDWQAAVVSDSATASLQAYPSETVQKIEELKPKEIIEQSPGVYVVNMGQNMAGWARISLKGKRGDKIVLRFAEKLNADGSLHTRNLRTAQCTDTYIMRGDGIETWEPRFTYHGFQYIEVSGCSATLTPDMITGIVVHSNLKKTGEFKCSSETINKIHSNIYWSQRSNYFEVPTDCPQRDERLGWTGDAQVFMRTAAYNMDIAAFFTKWIRDVNDGQFEDGRFPSTAPRVYNRLASGWGDAGVICPWIFFNTYSDTLILRQHYPAMRKWMDYLEKNSSDYISSMGSFGDWQNVKSETPIDVISTAYFKHCADIMRQVACVLKKPSDQAHYETLSANIFESFNTSFVESGTVKGNTQTANLLALNFELVPDSLRAPVLKNLLNNIEQAGQGLSTGILGTHLLLPTLSQNDKLEKAFQLLSNTKFPSWGHQIENGATTIWERWDSYSDSSGFHKDSTNSLNHYAYGAVGEWMYSTIVGIESDGPGYKHINICPTPGGGLTHAAASYHSVRGLIESSWSIDGDTLSLFVTIPPNTDATVYIPSLNEAVVSESKLPIETAQGVEFIKHESGKTIVRVGSGKYHFRSAYK